MLLEKAIDANAITQEKYITISVNKKSVEEARNYFTRVGAELITHFDRLGSKCIELEPDERLRIFHDFYRTGEETDFHFDIKETRKKGHDFKDFIYFMIGINKGNRVNRMDELIIRALCGKLRMDMFTRLRET